MRRASTSLLSYISRRKPNVLPALNSRTYSSEIVPCSISHGLLLKPHKFNSNPARDFDFLAEKSPRQRKLQEKSQLEEDFESAEDIDDMVAAFMKMEASCDEKVIGLAALKIGLKLDQEDENPEKVLDYGNRALSALDTDGKPSLPVTITLQLLGSARIGWLLLLTGKVQQAISFLESAAERLEASFGRSQTFWNWVHFTTTLELDRPQSAAQMFAVAKDIMDVALGPHHVDSIEACQNLSAQ